MRPLWIVFAKETVDNLRDRRAVFMALIYPFIGAGLLGLLLSFVGSMMQGQGEGRLELAVAGAEGAPALMAHLAAAGVELMPAPVDPAAAVRSGEAAAVLLVPPDYAERFARAEPVQIEILVNATRLSTVVSVARVMQLARAYADGEAQARLRARGVDPRVAAPLALRTVNVGGSRSIAGFFLNMLPPFLIFTAFVGGVYLAIDTTSGERERGSLEPLLANPAPRWSLMAGKALAAFAFTACSVALQLAAFKAMFEIVVRRDYGLDVNPDYAAFAAAFAIAVPLIAFAVALQMIVAIVSRSVKETQTYLALLPLVPSLPGMLLVFVPAPGAAWSLALPTFGQTLLIGRLMRQEPIALADAALASAATTLAAAALFWAAARLYERDEVLFGG